MEIGPVTELRILTPGERYWIEKAVGASRKGRGDDYALAMITRAEGRALRCQGEGPTPSDCDGTVTHYSLTSDGKEFRCYCARHWRKAGGETLSGPPKATAEHHTADSETS